VTSHRSFGFLDHFALWASLGASLFLMPFAALLVPALSIEQAVLATMVAGLIGGLLIASIAAIAANTGRSTAELLSEPFGQHGRWPVALLLMARHVLFAIFALVIIADSAQLISERALGVGLRGVWVVIFGAAGLALVLAGPERVSVGLRRAGLWLVLLVAVAVSASAYAEFEIPSYLTRPANGGWPSFWQATDVMLIFPLLWLPVVADFARFGRDSRSAARGSFAGVFVASIWFGVLGILYLPATSSGDIPGFLVGMQLGLGALVLLFLLQIGFVYANTYATVPTIEFLGAGTRARFAPALIIVAAIPAATLLHVADLEGYVLLAASIFIPAFAIVIARALWPAERPLAVPLVACLAGFLLYQWVTPADIGWWQDGWNFALRLARIPFPLSDSVTWLGAAVPAFLLAFGIDLFAPALARLLPVQRRANIAAG
jgi:nucleobase:cation symporter-1, NCS1 family